MIISYVLISIYFIFNYFVILSQSYYFYNSNYFITNSSNTRSSLKQRSLSTMSSELSNKTELMSLKWFEKLKDSYKHKHVKMREWNDLEWRNGEGGFSGRDFCHSPDASVRILDYILIENDESNINGLKLVGPVYFSPNAESHRGLCHGGSMCAIIDDVLGWMGFCSSGEILPWSGYTVQVNTSLRKSVEVGSILQLEAWIDRFESNRKVWVKGILKNSETNEIYCQGDGLFLKSLDNSK